MTTECVLPLSQLKTDLMRVVGIKTSNARKDSLAGFTQLQNIRKNTAEFKPEAILPPELFQGLLQPITNNVITAVRANIEHNKQTCVELIAGNKHILKELKNWIKEFEPLQIPDITLQNTTLRRRGDEYIIRIPAPLVRSDAITLPEGDIVIFLIIKVLSEEFGKVRIAGWSEFHINRNLRDMYKVHVIPIYRESHNVNVHANYPLEVAYTKVTTLIAKFQDMSRTNVRLDNLFSRNILLDFAGAGGTAQGEQTPKTQILFEIKRPHDFGGGRLVALPQEKPDPELNNETGRAFSPLKSSTKWAIIPHGHRIPRELPNRDAYTCITEMAFAQVQAAQRAFDTYVKPLGLEVVKRTILYSKGGLSADLSNWLHAQYSQVAVVSDGEAEPAPTIG